jgi:hypothetical protein
MAFCAKCGAKIPEGAGFCPQCGTQVGVLGKPEKQDYSQVGGTLVLVGGILGVVSSVLPLAIIPLVSGMMRGWMQIFRMWGMQGVPFWPVLEWVGWFTVARAAVGVVLGIIAIYAYTRIRAGQIKTGGTIATILGAIMLLTMGWLSGIITLVGGILCYTSK